jgi:hypothetical protein
VFVLRLLSFEIDFLTRTKQLQIKIGRNRGI